MSKQIINSKSITEIRTVFGLDKPTHPLITILDTEKLAYAEETVGKRFSSDLYCIALKDSSCGIDYGRNSYDFEDGVLMPQPMSLIEDIDSFYIASMVPSIKLAIIQE